MMHQEAEENVRRQFAENVAKLEIEQANAQMEYQTQKLREGNSLLGTYSHQIKSISITFFMHADK